MQNNGVPIVDNFSVGVAEFTMAAPGNISATISDGSVTLNWDAVPDVSSYMVKRYSALVGGVADLTTNVSSNLEFIDLGVINGETYFYTVTSVYDEVGEEESSPRISAQPKPFVTFANWGPSTNIMTTGYPAPSLVNTLETNLTDNSMVNTFIGDADGGTAVMWTKGNGSYNTNLITGGAPPLHGIVQTYTKPGEAEFELSNFQIRGDAAGDYIRERGNSANGYANALHWIEVSTNMTDGNTYSLELGCTTVNWGSLGAGAHKFRAAIRNGTQWYVSESFINSISTLDISDLNGENWATLAEAQLGATNMADHAGDFSLRTLDNVTAVGYFHAGFKNSHVQYFSLSAIQQGEETPESLYDAWLADNGYLSATNLTEDANGDGVNNLVDYALGGTLPDNSMTTLDGTNYLVYIHVEHDNASERGLSYVVQDASSLTSPDWADLNPVLEVGRSDPLDGMISVTNQVPADDVLMFLQLLISFTP